ncbi:ricin-type beta-trefoil lectin domain protein [Catellatospora sp. KI3]|uniref:LamG-like jellyroll fold domain-containing protein n=1 Tax=Catellatospora sp. KI3 TaxID=3041620 RepID=UPI00248289A7|nr:LamG-like jellyroll fold domain-containing protein [Catellatospora sp. KI3]MDI1462732.1 ricin-type beta-trefoil lectin domain protein [Catellatospora sp. KI3]
MAGLAVLLVANLGLPAELMPSTGEFPLASVWSWLVQHPAWAGGDFVGVPVQGRGKAREGQHYVPASATDVNGVSRGPVGEKKPKRPFETPRKEGRFDPATSKRVADQSTETSDLFRNEDGTYSRKVFSDPINFRDGKGVWRSIDRGLARSGNRFGQKAAPTDLSLAVSGADGRLVTMGLGRGRSVSYGLAGAADVAGVAEANAVVYPSIQPGVDLKVEVLADGYKDTLVLESAQSPSEFVFPLELKGLTASLAGDGSVVFTDGAGAVQASIPAGYMFDSQVDQASGDFVTSYGVSYELIAVDGGPALKVTADRAWLEDPARVYPVSIDPSSFKTNSDTYVYKTDTVNHSTANNLAVGTYDGGTHVAKSLMSFSGFSTTYNGATLQAVSLAAYLTWTWNCTASQVWVKKITSSWSASAKWPGPNLDPTVIGWDTPAPGKACTNTAANRSVGRWTQIALNVPAIQSWLTGGANYGLALVAPNETTSNYFKRYTSRDYNNYAYAPYLLLTYSGPNTPQIDATYPPSGYNSASLRPVLVADAHDPDKSGTLTYDFAVYDDDNNKIDDSGWKPSSTYQVSANKLVRGKTYQWTVAVTDGGSISALRWSTLTTLPPQPLVTSTLSRNSGRGFEPSIGNYTTAATDAVVTTVGPPLTIERSYNSQDPRTAMALGAGWSSMLDMQASHVYDTAGAIQGVTIRYASGQETAFGISPDGTFAAPGGRGGTLTCVDGSGQTVTCSATVPPAGGYDLLEKDGTRYSFRRKPVTVEFPQPLGGPYPIKSITDLAGRKLTFTIQNNRISQITSASGRSLYLDWTTTTPVHVDKIRTDELIAGNPSSASVWDYDYSGDLLAQVCPPTSATMCTTYQYATGTTPGSLYPSVVRNLGATSNWRLAEASGTTVAASSVTTTAGADNGTYRGGVTLGQPGPITGLTSTAASFNGTDATVALPQDISTESGYRSASLWFKTTTPGKVLLSQSVDDPGTQSTTKWGYNPTLYVDSNGKLAGQFPTLPGAGYLGALTGGGSGYCVDVHGSQTTDGAAVALWTCLEQSNQRWTLSGSTLRVTMNGITRCLDGNDGSQNKAVVSWTCNGSAAQNWRLDSNGNIVFTATNRCLSVSGASTAQGANLVLWTCKTPLEGDQIWSPTAHAPISDPTSATVTDGAWHHAVLSAAGDTQTLYLDGQPIGTKSGLVIGGRQRRQFIGSGYLGGGWPNQPYPSTLHNIGTASFFNGTVGEVAFFDKPLTSADVTALNSARGTLARPLTKILRPSGKVGADVTYNSGTGEFSQLIDENGGTWSVNAPAYEGSHLAYSTTVLGASPSEYWRLAETEGSDAVSEVGGSLAQYTNGVVLGATDGPFGDTDSPATFNGTGSYVSLPASVIPVGGEKWSMSLWFRVPDGSTTGGVIFSYQDGVLGTNALLNNPALYVGTDGRLRGKVWQGSGPAISSATQVNDGQWHHAAISTAAATQTLYLDGTAVGSLSGTIVPNGQPYAYLGAGEASTSTNWPYMQGNLTGYFNGDLAEVAFYKGTQLNAAQVQAQFSVRNKATGTSLVKKYTITDPTGGSLLSQSYALPSGRKVATTDGVGNQTLYGFDAIGQLQTVVDANGNFSESEHDARGNTVSQTSCLDRKTDDCGTTYYTYTLNISNLQDPCNDKMATSRDGRSASETDDTYLTTFTYDAKCNLVMVTDALGRRTVTVYSGDQDTAAADTGYVPAGLPTKITSPAGTVQSVSYYQSGDVATVTDPAGMTTTYQYDRMGRVISKTDKTSSYPAGLTMTISYDKQSRVAYQVQPQVTDRITGAVHRAQTWIDYDDDGNVRYQEVSDLDLVDAKRGTWTYYNQYNQVSSVKDELDHVTSFGYDPMGNQKTVTRPDGTILETVYDPAGQVTTTKVLNWKGDPNNPIAPTVLVTSQRAYDPAGRLATVTDAMGWQTKYEYYDNGQVAKVIRTDGAATDPKVYVVEQNTYDQVGNLVKKVSENGATTETYHVDAASRTDSTTIDPSVLKRTTSITLDDDDRAVASTSTDGVTGNTLAFARSAYDPKNGILSQTVYGGPAGTNPANVPVGRWQLDATTGTVAADAVGNNPGTATGGVTWSTDHAITATTGSAVFDGTGSITGTTGSADTANSFTVAAWVKLDAAAAAPVVIASQDGKNVSGFTLYFNKANGRWTFAMPQADANGAASDVVISSSAAATGVWTHVAGVFNANDTNNTDTVKIYVNGTLAGTTTRLTKPWSAAGATVIGGGKAGGDLNARPDLVTRTTGGNLVLYPNNGAASGSSLGAATTVATGVGGLTYLNLADLNGDGRADMIGRDASGALLFYPNTGAYGSASFGSPVTLSATAFSASTWIVTGDFNGDGRVDVMSRDGSGNMLLFRNAGNRGGSPVLAANSELVRTGFNVLPWIGAADTNRDGYTDLLGLSTSNIAYQYLNSASTTISFSAAVQASASAVAGTGMSTGDYNADGRADLVGRDAGGAVWLYPGTGGATPNIFGTGTQIGSVALTGINLHTTANLDGDAAARWRGSIDDVQIYQRALSDAEITTLKNANGAIPAANATVTRTSSVLDTAGLPTASVDPLGNLTEYIYDEAARLAVTKSPSVTTETFGSQGTGRAISYLGYDAFGAVVRSQDALGQLTTIKYDKLGQVVETTLPAYTPPGSSTPLTPVAKKEYDELGQVATVTDPLNNSTHYVYDQLGQAAKVTGADGGYTTYTYDAIGDPLSVTSPTGAVSQATYDFLGRKCTSTQLVRQPSAQTLTTTYSYGSLNGGPKLCTQAVEANDAGRLTKVDSPGHLITLSAYNEVGEVSGTTDPAGKLTSYRYDALGRRTRTTLPDSTYSEATFDFAGLTVAAEQRDHLGALLARTTTAYDRAGRPVSVTDPKSKTSTFTYDATGMLVSQSQPVSSTAGNIVTTFGYDLAGHATRFTDGRGNAFWTTYNVWGLPESQIEPATTAHPNLADRTYTTAYDKAGNAVTRTSPGGVTVVNTYDEVGNLVRQSGSGAEAATTDRVFDYDLAGRPTSISRPGGDITLAYDDADRMLSVTGGSLGDTAYQWSPDGLLTSRTDAAGQTTFGYNAGRLASVTNGTTQIQYSNYNDLGMPRTISYGGTTGVTTRTLGYDDAHRLRADEVKSSTNAQLGKISYEYDANGNEIQKTVIKGGVTTVNDYTYDDANRLMTWTANGALTEYDYDRSGNRVKAGSNTFTYDQRNRLLTSGSTTYGYTARGTLQTTTQGTVPAGTTADAFDQVASQTSTAGVTQNYTYDGLGRAVQAGHKYSGISNTIAADDPTPGSPTSGDEGIYLRGPGGSALSTTVGAAQRYLWTDLHTDVVGQFTATGASLAGSATYDPFGKPIGTPTLIGRLGYQSEWTDTSTGRINMAARWYNPDTGQFDSRDTASNSPIGSSGAANRYAYANANPLTLTDPSGHWPTYSSEGDWSQDQDARRTYNQQKKHVPGNDGNKGGGGLRKVPCAQTDKPYHSQDKAMRGCGHESKPVCPHTPSGVSIFMNCTELSITNDSCYINGIRLKRADLGDMDCVELAQKVDSMAGIYEGYDNDAYRQAITAQILEDALNVTAKEGAVRAKKEAEAKCKASFTCRNAGLLGAVVGVVAGVGCGLLLGWTGVGGVACGFVGGFVGALATGLFEGRSLDDPGLWISAAIGGGIGALTAGLLSGLGAGVAAGARGLFAGVGGRAAGGAAWNALTGELRGIVTGRFSGGLVSRMMANRAGGGAAGRAACAGGSLLKQGAVALAAGLGVTALFHSFEGQTPVLMADGSSKPLADVRLGDEVKATDPLTGVTEAKRVIQLHRNQDVDLADVAIEDTGSGATSVLHTTWHHPFWNVGAKRWDEAADLKPGTVLRDDEGKETQRVVSVKTWTGLQEMLDLTVEDVHTYYVLAGGVPVLVHNCGEGPVDHVALGRNVEGTFITLENFADEIGARHLMGMGDEWRAGVEKAIARLGRGEGRISFMIDHLKGSWRGVDSAIKAAEARAEEGLAKGMTLWEIADDPTIRFSQTQAELLTIKQAGLLDRVDFFWWNDSKVRWTGAS